MANDKIFVLSGNFGDGHRQAAKAIIEAAERSFPGMATMHADFMELTHPIVHPVSRYIFLQGMKSMPSAYGYLYSKTRGENAFSGMLKSFNRYGLGRLLKLLRTERPSIVVSTFPPAAGAMSMLKQYGLTEVPTVTCITDHTDHSYWIYPHTDHYIVGSHDVKQALAKYGIPCSGISVTGIPIRSAFRETYDRNALIRKHGLDPSLPTLLLMGGGCGVMEDSRQLVSGLDALPFPIQCIVVCGRNRQLQQQWIKHALLSEQKIHVKGYVEDVHELMSVAHLMVTKPGGLTISEALAVELPMLLYKPLPGQEEDNAKFLLKSGAALKADNRDQLIHAIAERLRDPEQTLKSIKGNARILQRKHAADDALHVLKQVQDLAFLQSSDRVEKHRSTMVI